MRLQKRWSRGEGWVLGQMLLLVAIVLAPAMRQRWPKALCFMGVLFGSTGLAVAALAAYKLGPNLTPLPHPKDDSAFVGDGLYQLVRHPIYSGLLLAAFGWSLIRSSMVGLLFCVGLALLFDRKASLEERWLRERYPNYAEYRQRAQKLVPWLY